MRVSVNVRVFVLLCVGVFVLACVWLFVCV